MSRAVAVVVIAGMLCVAGCSSSSSSHAPDPPTKVTVAPANASGKVSFTPPASDGGRAISGYTVVCKSGSTPAGTKAGSASPIVVSGLANGHSYTCTVAAENASGTGDPSAPSSPFVPVTVPTAPTPAAAVPYASGVAKVAWNAPSNTGGTPITGYAVTPYLGSVAQPVKSFNSTSTTQQISGLTNGRAYQFSIAARNAVGISALSAKTGVMTAGAPGQPGDAKAAKVASGTLRVTFVAPANNGASITTYTATCTATNNSAKQSNTGPGTTITLSNRALSVANLTPGHTFTCTVRASNSRGVGPNSAPSPPATP